MKPWGKKKKTAKNEYGNHTQQNPKPGGDGELRAAATCLSSTTWLRGGRDEVVTNLVEGREGPWLMFEERVVLGLLCNRIGEKKELHLCRIRTRGTAVDKKKSCTYYHSATAFWLKIFSTIKVKRWKRGFVISSFQPF